MWPPTSSSHWRSSIPTATAGAIASSAAHVGWSPIPVAGVSPGVAVWNATVAVRVSLPHFPSSVRAAMPLAARQTLSFCWNSRTPGPRMTPPVPTAMWSVVPAIGAARLVAPARLATCCSTGAPPSIRTPPPGDAVSSLVHVAASTVPLTVMCCPAWNALTNAVITIVNTPSICSGAAAPAKALSFCCARATSGPVEPDAEDRPDRRRQARDGGVERRPQGRIGDRAGPEALRGPECAQPTARRRPEVAIGRQSPPAAVARLSFSCSSRTASPVCPSRSSGCAGMKPPSGMPHRCTVGRRPAR